MQITQLVRRLSMGKFSAIAFLLLGTSFQVVAQQTCWESREGASEVTPTETASGIPTIKCSDKTDGVLWWNDPFEGTVPMGDMPLEGDYSHGEAVVKPRSAQQALYPLCGVACHNGIFPPPNSDKSPRVLTFHQDVVPDATNLQHGRGSIWCLDCHHPDTRNTFVDHLAGEIDFNQPQVLCGKCHGPAYQDWREGLHGKRIGEFASDGKKRWFVCTECHNPHDVQQGDRNSGFAQIEPEAAPLRPDGTSSAVE
ncbi:MAG: hypothetical protein ABGX05_19320 [Pirellulaceae bacterium]